MEASATCKLTKVRERTAHGQYTSVQYSGPGVAVGIEFYSMMLSDDGMRAILTLCDLFSSWTVFCAVPDTTAVTAANCLLRNWIYVRGCPSQTTRTRL